ncbi:MAG: hypothetical protein ACKO3W_13020, partial [bacterium]
FVAPNRVMTTSNFAVAEQEFQSKDAHGTWGAWAHESDGAMAHRIPEPRNVNLLEATRCLSDAEAKDLIGSLAAERGRSTKGPPITWVMSRGQMGSGRVTGGVLNVYAPVITGSPPAPGENFLVNPPAPPVQRAMPIARAAAIPRAQPIGRAAPTQPLNPVQPAPQALPNPSAAPNAPLAPYDAFTYQQESLDEYHVGQYDALRQLHAADSAQPPMPGMTPAQTKAWQQREQHEMQRMAARQRRLLDAKQAESNESAEAAEKTSTPQSSSDPAQP